MSIFIGLVYKDIKSDHISEVWIDFETSFYVKVDSYIYVSDTPFDCGGYLCQIFGTEVSEF